MVMKSGGFGLQGQGMKVNTRCAGSGGCTSSIASKKEQHKPKKPKTDIFAART
jgi:hypothetical protein